MHRGDGVEPGGDGVEPGVALIELVVGCMIWRSFHV